MARTFKGGIHPDYKKDLTSELSIERFEMPNRATLFMSQHIGAPCRPIVKKGDMVKTGQVIGEPQGFVSVPVHASITGKVADVTEMHHPVQGRPETAVIIEREGEDEWAEGTCQDFDPSDSTPEELRQKIHDAGIVGLGGATFPTHVKLNPPPNKPIDTAVLDGAECEPYLTCDDRLIREKPREIVLGLRILLKILNCNRAIIAIEENKPEAIEVMKAAVEQLENKADICVRGVEVKYPAGQEHMLIAAILKREVPWKGGLPMEIGTVCQNVATVNAIYEAVYHCKPLVERVLTITGDALKRRGNYIIRLGTPVEELLNYAEPEEGASKLIIGGPMMGLAQFSADIPVMKGTSGILLLKNGARYESGPCIKCGRCVRACPIRLMPAVFSRAIEAGDIDYAAEVNVMECKECGCCAYVCPSKRPMVHQVKYAKALLAAKKAEREANAS